MKVKNIYLVRHGQTDFNKQGIVQGSGVDSDINALGHLQAEAFFEAYKHIAFDKIYTSALKRSIQSVQNFINLGIPHEIHAGLNEISWGRKEGQAITPAEDAYYHFVLEEWRRGNETLAIEGGESPVQVMNRQKPVIDLILSRPEEENILICMHGRAMRILLCLILNYELKDMDRFEHENLCLDKLCYTGSMFVVESYYNTQHLLPMKEKNGFQ